MWDGVLILSQGTGEFSPKTQDLRGIEKSMDFQYRARTRPYTRAHMETQFSVASIAQVPELKGVVDKIPRSRFIFRVWGWYYLLGKLHYHFQRLPVDQGVP
jgi:hypothetical protein